MHYCKTLFKMTEWPCYILESSELRQQADQ